MYKGLEESVHRCLADKEHTKGEGGRYWSAAVTQEVTPTEKAAN